MSHVAAVPAAPSAAHKSMQITLANATPSSAIFSSPAL